MQTLDWSLIQSFTAVVEAGSLAGAARLARGSQPTMSRHMAVLEAKLGVQLFDRTGSGLVLTPTGVALYEEARRMGEASKRFALTAVGQAESIAGTIRISASDIMATWVLPPLLTRLNQLEPEITIELVSSDQSSNLLMREADIAVRMFRPTQAELITRKVGSVKIGMYAARNYLDRHGIPQSPEDLNNHVLICGDRNTEIEDGFKAAGVDLRPETFRFRCDSRHVQWQMVLAGFGIGFIQREVGDYAPDIVAVLPHQSLADLPIWLTCHAELRTSRRVRRVYDFLAAELCRGYGA
ncbi:HTH-type transcriptional regulator CysL [Candidatus Phycosocius bacilliformis]|uniref:HTH-type transcriptional regulator CysL n=1 Tax=Candidatus Phycosocius bacilliformis TaxID=1445552 RepID=A0A2P2EA80_9PROT|nr:LysR family transcriptional regulator [Candidatus Phycosocius bacilliformis]GBF57953.1 HTH-type transcriptional regulator CysL [Candidatus Phycosocius bacilliformis]